MNWSTVRHYLNRYVFGDVVPRSEYIELLDRHTSLVCSLRAEITVLNLDKERYMNVRALLHARHKDEMAEVKAIISAWVDPPTYADSAPLNDPANLCGTPPTRNEKLLAAKKLKKRAAAWLARHKDET